MHSCAQETTHLLLMPCNFTELTCMLAVTQSPSASQERRGRQRFTARCHVHDICAVMQASMRQPRPGGVYNVVDDVPAPRSAVLLWCVNDALLHNGSPTVS